MKKHLFAAILLSAACGSNPPPSKTTPAPTPTSTSTDTASTTPEQATGAQPAVATNPKKGKAEIGDWGFDKEGMNTKVAPGASFYEYANGTWLKNTPIPQDKSRYGMF